MPVTVLPTVRAVDAEPQIRRTLRHALLDGAPRIPARVAEAATADSALAQTAAARPALVVLDLGPPDAHGLDVCRALRAGFRA